MSAGAIGDVGEDLGPVLELNPVDAVGKRLHDDPLHERGALGHERRLYQRPGIHGWCAYQAPTTSLLSAGERDEVSTIGPLSVMATVCSK